MFLTTQYLEEADVLADRVGIIDHGHIVAEGTPDALKAEIGRPSVEATPADRGGGDDIARVLARFGAAVPAPPGAAAVRLDERRRADGGGARARRERPRGRRPPAPPAEPGRRLPDQDRPQARRRGRDGEREAVPE